MQCLRGSIALLVLGCFLSAGIFGPVGALGETYTLTSSPGRSQEDSSSGVDLTLAVSNATTSTPYSFTWTVTDPSGTAKTAANSTVSTQTSWALSVNYPQSFSGASLSLVGVYMVNVSQTAPTLSQNVALGNFQVGLTDSLSYQRTFPVSIEAGGYLPGENVTVDINGPSLVPGYPLTRATANGHLTHSWQIPCNIATGLYTVTLAGSTTSKAPADSQPIAVYPTNVTILQLSTSKTSFQRTETVETRFSANYLSGNPACGGSATVRLAEQDGTSFHNVQATYDPALGTFLAAYRIPSNVQTGSWVATIVPGAFDDGYGNRGPVQSPLKGFAVQPASLSVSIGLSSAAYSLGELMVLYASVTNPDGSSFTDGSVTASLSSSGRSITSPVSLLYDQTMNRWTGSYTVGSADPSGTWLVEVDAFDPYGNGGKSSSTSVVSVPPQPGYATTFTWLLPLLVVFGLGILVILHRYRQVSRSEVKLDVQAVKTQAAKVREGDFLQSIQAQLKRKEERMAKEKHEE